MSFKQRHRPIFQLFMDLVLALFSIFLTAGGYLLTRWEYVVLKDDTKK